MGLQIRFAVCLILTALFAICNNVQAALSDRDIKNRDALIKVYVTDKTGAPIHVSKAVIVDTSGIILIELKAVKIWMDKVSNKLIAKDESGRIFEIDRLIAHNIRLSIALVSLEMRGGVFKEKEGFSERSPYTEFVSNAVATYKKRLAQKRSEGVAKETTTELPAAPRLQMDEPTIKDSAYYKGIGRRFLISKRYADSQNAYHQALDKDPKDIETLLALAAVYTALGRLDEAASYYKRAYSQQRSNDTLKKLAVLMIIAGSYTAAIENLSIYLKDDPLDASARYSLAIAYLLLGDKDSSYNEYIRLSRIDKVRAEDIFEILYR